MKLSTAIPDSGLADPGQRLLARIVDMLMVGVPVGLVREEADAATVLWLAGLLFLYEFGQLAFWGRTLGKRFAGIAVQVAPPATASPTASATARAAEPVTDAAVAGGGRAGPGIGLVRALLRTGCYVLPIAARPVPVLGVLAGLFWVVNAAALLEGARRALHDRLAGTVVIRAGR